MSWALPLTNARITSGFGPRDINVPNASTFHRGVDLVNADHRVMSVGSGSVLATGWNDYRGRWVAVRHTDGTTATYQHLASIAVSKGRSVSAGTFLGTMGNSSNPAVYQLAVHLHLEWFPAGRFLLNGDAFASTDRAVDPIPQLRARGVDLRVGTVSNTTTVPVAPVITLPKPITTTPEEDEIMTVDAREFLAMGYRQEVGREAAESELYPRLRRIIAGTTTLAQEIDGIDKSLESNRWAVIQQYRELLGRDGTIEDWDSWIAATGNDVSKIRAGIIASDEYKAKHQ